MKIKREAVENFLGPVAEESKVSLFVISTKKQRVKKLSLENLTPGERAAKLHKWAQQDRFVAVIEIGDTVFASVHFKHVDLVQRLEEDLTSNGKKVIVRALNQEEAAELSAIGEAFETHALEESKEEKESDTTHNSSIPRQYFSRSRLIADQMHTHDVFSHMIKHRIGTIILNCLQKYNEEKREMQKQKEADDKHFDIKRNEIKKDILREEIKLGEIKGYQQKQRIIGEDVQRINRMRVG